MTEAPLILSQPIPVDDPTVITDQDHRALFDFWHSIRRGSGIPDQRDFDVLLVPRRLLSSLFYMEYLPETDDFLQRVAGTTIDENLGFAASGKLLSELPARSNLYPVQKAVIATGQPHLSEAPYYGKLKNGRAVRRISLPLRKDGEVRMILGLTKFDFEDTRQARKRIFPSLTMNR